MEYANEVASFYAWAETNPLNASCISLWHALMHIAIRPGVGVEFTVPLQVLSTKSGLKRDALIAARDRLVQAGRITCTQRGGSSSATYRMILFEEVEPFANSEPFVSEVPTQMPTQMPTQTTDEEFVSEKPTQNPTQMPTQSPRAREGMSYVTPNVIPLKNNKPREYQQLLEDIKQLLPNFTAANQSALERHLAANVKPDVIRFATEEASRCGVLTWGYVEAILRRMVSDGVTSAGQAQQQREQRDRGRSSIATSPNQALAYAQRTYAGNELEQLVYGAFFEDPVSP